MLNDADIARLDERYVQKDNCTVLRADTDRRIDAIVTDMAVLKTKLNTLIGILSGIAVPVLAIAVKLLFGGA